MIQISNFMTPQIKGGGGQKRTFRHLLSPNAYMGDLGDYMTGISQTFSKNKPVHLHFSPTCASLTRAAVKDSGRARKGKYKSKTWAGNIKQVRGRATWYLRGPTPPAKPLLYLNALHVLRCFDTR